MLTLTHMGDGVATRKRSADDATLSQSTSSIRRPPGAGAAGGMNSFLVPRVSNTNAAGGGVMSRNQSFHSRTGESSDQTDHDLDMSRDSSQDSRGSRGSQGSQGLNLRGSSPIDPIGIAEFSSQTIDESFYPLPDKVVMKKLSDSLGYERSSLTDSQRKSVGQKEGTRTPISKSSNLQPNIRKFGITVLDVSFFCIISLQK